MQWMNRHDSGQSHRRYFPCRFGLRGFLVGIAGVALGIAMIYNGREWWSMLVPVVGTSVSPLGANELVAESPPGSQMFLELQPSGRRFPCGVVRRPSGNVVCRFQLVRRGTALDIIDATRGVVLMSVPMSPEDRFVTLRGSRYSEVQGEAFELFTIRSNTTSVSGARLIVAMRRQE